MTCMVSCVTRGVLFVDRKRRDSRNAVYTDELHRTAGDSRRAQTRYPFIGAYGLRGRPDRCVGLAPL
jgi:hypothetical protein